VNRGYDSQRGRPSGDGLFLHTAHTTHDRELMLARRVKLAQTLRLPRMGKIDYIDYLAIDHLVCTGY
jgi:hypothetical protein